MTLDVIIVSNKWIKKQTYEEVCEITTINTPMTIKEGYIMSFKAVTTQQLTVAWLFLKQRTPFLKPKGYIA